MSISSEDLEDSAPVSAWWLRIIIAVMVTGFAMLVGITVLAYRNAPPIPERVVDAQGHTLFTGADIGDGQAIFLKYGLMDNGSIWGHGAYLGPDYSALALHGIGQDTARVLANRQYGKSLTQLVPIERAAVQAQVAVLLKTNRYDAQTDVLRLTPAAGQITSGIPQTTAA